MIIGPTPSFARVDRFFGPLNFAVFGGLLGRPHLAISADARKWFVRDFPAPAGYSSSTAMSFLGPELWLFCRKGSTGETAAMVTENGDHWDFIPIAPVDVTSTTNHRDVCRLASGRLIVAGAGNSGKRLWTSDDRSIWTPRADKGADYASADSSGAVIAALRTDRAIDTSSDGINWTQRASNLGAASGGSILRRFPELGLFAAGTNAGTLSTSADGLTWSARTSGATAIQDIAGGDGKYVIGTTGDVRISSDLLTWGAAANVPVEFTGAVRGAAYVDGRHVLMDQFGVTIAAEDGNNFALVDGNFPFDQPYSFTGRRD